MNHSAPALWNPPTVEALPQAGAPLRDLIQFASRYDPTPLFRERWGQAYPTNAMDLWQAQVSAFRSGGLASGNVAELMLAFNYAVAVGPYSGDASEFLEWLIAGLRQRLASEAFGCSQCWPVAAGQAWAARSGLRPAASLVDESHFGVRILECPHCGQQFLSIFTELISWSDGDDSQEWRTLPLAAHEAAELVAERETLTEARLCALDSGRRCLSRAYPSGGQDSLSWGTGVFIGLHD